VVEVGPGDHRPVVAVRALGRPGVDGGDRGRLVGRHGDRRAQTEACPECAALVTDLARHATWHSRVAQSGASTSRDDDGRGPGDRIIGNMR